jgi:hypothetical protein
MTRTRKPAKRITNGITLSEMSLCQPKAPKPPLIAPTPTVQIAPNPPFRLLDLPLELVIRVLDFAVIHSSKDDPINIPDAVARTESRKAPHASGRPYKKATWRLVQPAITRTCRLLRAEGLPTFYARNVFAAYSNMAGLAALGQFCGAVGVEHRARLHLYVQWARWRAGSPSWVFNGRQAGSLYLETSYFVSHVVRWPFRTCVHVRLVTGEEFQQMRPFFYDHEWDWCQVRFGVPGDGEVAPASGDWLGLRLWDDGFVDEDWIEM